MKDIKDGFKSRIRLTYVLFFIFGIVLVARLFYLQVVKNNYYQNEGERQYVASSVEKFDRGTIYFMGKNGQLVSAATIKKGFEVAVNPTILENPENAYEKLSKIIEIKKEDFFKHLENKKDPYEVVAQRVEDEDAKKIMNLKIKGLDAFLESWRYYPGNNLASRILGFVGYKDDVLSGRYGLEKQYDLVLNLNEGAGFMNSFAEIFSNIKKTITGEEKGDIVLTIEPSVQSFLEKKLGKARNDYNCQTVGGIIIEPKTGKILAMVAKPDFNPNSYSETKDFSLFMNPNVESVFEIGSIMKPLTIAAAMNEGKVSSKTFYTDKGYVIVDGKQIKNYDGKAMGKVGLQDILDHSINTGAVFVMEQLGREKFKDYLINFGLGEKTGIDLSEEVRGKIKNVTDSPREIEYANASFGQGFSATPIAMATALSSLANGGNLMKPYIVQQIKIKGGVDKIIEPKVIRQVLDKKTSEEVSRMLVKVFDEALMNGIYKMERYSVATKTGTAQYVEEGEKGYKEDEYVHTFFGYAPAFDPKFLVLLYLIKPQGVRYASFSLSEPFVNTMKFLLNYYEVPPDR